MQHIASHEYDGAAKELTVHFTDGTSATYHNVGVVAASWLQQTENKTAFWQRYIEPVYMKVRKNETIR